MSSASTARPSHSWIAHLAMALVFGLVSCSEAPTGLLNEADGPPIKASHTLDKLDHVPEGTVTASNGVYEIFVQDNPGSGVGLYTARTGPSHPVTIETGSPQNVFFGGADGRPGTTYNTIRSFTTGTDYLQTGFSPGSDFTVVSLDPSDTPAIAATLDAIGSTGWRTTYVLPGPPGTPDALTIEQDVNINGTSFENSSIEVTTTVTNDGSSGVSLGIRYLWDYQIGADDGPTFARRSPDGAPIVTEADFADPAFGFYRIQDNDLNIPTPLFSVFGSVNGPGGVTPTPTAPDLVQHVHWRGAFGRAFDYTTDNTLDVSSTTNGFNDDAVTYLFGDDPASALVLAPGQSVTVSQSVFAAPSDAPPPLAVTPVEVDIKPGSDPNALALSDQGKLPVAVLTTGEFDAASVDPSTVTLGDDTGGDTPVALRPNGTLFASLEDVDSDSDADLILHFNVQKLIENGDLDATTTTLLLSGETLDGTPIEGSDTVRPLTH